MTLYLFLELYIIYRGHVTRKIWYLFGRTCCRIFYLKDGGDSRYFEDVATNLLTTCCQTVDDVLYSCSPEISYLQSHYSVFVFNQLMLYHCKRSKVFHT